jgi:hypothetical protein
MDPRARRGILVLLVAAVVVIVIALLNGGGGDNGNGGPVPPTIASGSDLTDLAKDAGHTVYWAGERPGTRTEFQEDQDGNVYIRYLPLRGNPASQRSKSLTVGSYPVGNAVAGLEVVANRPGENTYKLPTVPGAIAVSSVNKPTSIYVAFPGSAVQVEVFDPDPARGLQTVMQGEITRLGG